ncbi:3-hydroxyacyl-thioester dehydratase X-like [Haliotis asinina]|uniref:3-hydroxyacyl-thioester dehydratase X-like n=1 Tax=Haliotis asinina TaxID=109174 RepID=UPI0035319152
MAALVVVVGVLILMLTVFLLSYALFLSEKVEYTFDNKPSFQKIILRSVFGIVARKQGRLYIKKNGASVSSAQDTPTQAGKSHERTPANPLHKVSVTNCRMDVESLEAYKKISCVKTNDAVPICYPETLFIRLLAFLATSLKAGLGPLGLIHIKQTITQHRPLDDLLDGGFDLHARAVRYVEVEKGIEGYAECKVTDCHNFCVWEGMVTVLSRSPRAQKSGTSRNTQRTATTETIDDNLLGECLLPAPLDTGVRYARATKDWNPHHIYPWTARLLGYRAPIAHGMWTLARTLDELFGNDNVKRSYPIHVDATFKRPLFMPGVAKIQYGKDKMDRSQLWFKCSEQSSGAPLVIGTVQMGK